MCDESSNEDELSRDGIFIRFVMHRYSLNKRRGAFCRQRLISRPTNDTFGSAGDGTQPDIGKISAAHVHGAKQNLTQRHNTHMYRV